MGRGGQDEPAGKSEITSDEKKGSVVGHFSSRSLVKMPDIRSASRLIIFSEFHLGRNPNLNRLPNFPACFATVADRSAVWSRGSLKASFGQQVLAAS